MPFPLPAGDPCYFCELAEGRSGREHGQWNVIERTALTISVLNGRQFEIGQCIVSPVRHAPTLLDLSEEEGAAVMAAAKRLTSVMVRAFAPDGVLLYQNNGIGSGQEVPHFHLHVVPRRANSDWGFGPPHIARLEGGQRAPRFDHTAMTDAKLQTVEEIRRHLPAVFARETG